METDILIVPLYLFRYFNCSTSLMDKVFYFETRAVLFYIYLFTAAL